MCSHPNIIDLVDLYESSDFYHIVLEHLDGDLFDYLKKRNFRVPETRAK